MDGQPHTDPVPALLRRRAPLRSPQGRCVHACPTHHGAAFLRCARREPRPSVTRAGGLWGAGMVTGLGSWGPVRPCRRRALVRLVRCSAVGAKVLTALPLNGLTPVQAGNRADLRAAPASPGITCPSGSPGSHPDPPQHRHLRFFSPVFSPPPPFPFTLCPATASTGRLWPCPACVAARG